MAVRSARGPRPRPEPALRLNPGTLVMATEAFRPGAVARVVERRVDAAGQSIVVACPERFAVRLTDLERERAARQEGEPE